MSPTVMRVALWFAGGLAFAIRRDVEVAPPESVPLDLGLVVLSFVVPGVSFVLFLVLVTPGRWSCRSTRNARSSLLAAAAPEAPSPSR